MGHLKKTLLWGLILVSTACVGPSSPSAKPAPASTPMQDVLHHNIPAVDDAGTIWYLCATQIRTYLLPVQGHPDTFIQQQNRDHYIQRETCPTILIN